MREEFSPSACCSSTRTRLSINTRAACCQYARRKVPSRYQLWDNEVPEQRNDVKYRNSREVGQVRARSQSIQRTWGGGGMANGGVWRWAYARVLGFARMGGTILNAEFDAV